jgi:hypothetical protein
MPSFPNSVSPAEAWYLVHLIRSLSPKYVKNRAGTPTLSGEGAL